MTETDWLRCTSFREALEPLRSTRNTRKWRCFALACVRLIWDDLTPTRQHAIEVAERYLDGQATNRERAQARRKITIISGPEAELMQSKGKRIATEGLVDAVHWATAASQDIAIGAQIDVPFNIHRVVRSDRGTAAAAALDAVFLGLLRDIFGNPFRPVLADALPRSREVIGLAQAVYEERNLPSGELDGARLAVLADALEEAGCTDAIVLDHLRGPGPHIRGCWPLDLLIKKPGAS